VYERNQCQRSVSDEPAPTWWIWAGVQCVIAGMGGRSTPKPRSFAGGEVMVKVGIVALTEQGQG
jgi:hypothetical protein